MRKLLLMLLTVVLLVALCGCGSEPEPSSTEVSGTVTENIAYKIHSIEEDINTTYGGQTYIVYVVIKEPANTEQLKVLCQAVATDVQESKNNNSNAILIYPVDYQEYIGEGLPLGKAAMLPNGSWQWELKEKDWANQLTPDEVEIWAMRNKLWLEKNAANPAALIDGNDVTNEVAQQLNIQPETIDEILSKFNLWMVL